MSAVTLYNKYKGGTRFANGTYYDPDGADVGLAVVDCTECFFRHGESCAVYKEKGRSDREIFNQKRSVSEKRYCDYFLSDFMDDSAAKKEINNHKQKVFGSTRSSSSNASIKQSGSKSWILWIIIGLVALYFFK